MSWWRDDCGDMVEWVDRHQRASSELTSGDRRHSLLSRLDLARTRSGILYTTRQPDIPLFLLSPISKIRARWERESLPPKQHQNKSSLRSVGITHLLPIQQLVLTKATTFKCLFCHHDKAVTVKMSAS